jgi:hypothetical protein
MIKVREPIAPNLDSLLTPEDKIILRCVDCQTFMLPKQLHMFTIRFRQGGYPMALPVEICPYCFNTVESAEKVDVRPEDVPRSCFLTMDRFQYEQTKQAERWGLNYDLKTNQVVSKSLLIT